MVAFAPVATRGLGIGAAAGEVADLLAVVASAVVLTGAVVLGRLAAVARNVARLQILDLAWHTHSTSPHS